MEVRPTPAGLTQLTQARDGRLIEVDDDTAGVARALSEIDHRLRLRFSEPGDYWVVYYLPDEWEEGDGYQIFTAQELDHRIVNHMQEVYWRCQQPGYSFADELEAEQDRKRAEQGHQFTEEMGEMYERLAYALRKDTGRHTARAYVPEGPDDDAE